MATATLSTVTRPASSPRKTAARRATGLGAATVSIAGLMVAIGVAAVSLLIVPLAALVVFGPALFDLLR
jgi:hypothetical protein